MNLPLSRHAGILLSILILSTAACSEQTPSNQETPELAAEMSNIQRFTQKMMLSAHARNRDLARFYLHEMEETAETIAEEVPEYEGHPVGPLMEKMLLGKIETAHETWSEKRWPEIRRDIDGIIQACNQCHQSTAHGFIVIPDTARGNPYLQTFEPQR